MNASRHNTIENHTNYPEDAIALTSSCQNFGIRYLEPRSFRETRQDVRRTPPTGAKTKESKSIISGRGGGGRGGGGGPDFQSVGRFYVGLSFCLTSFPLARMDIVGRNLVHSKVDLIWEPPKPSKWRNKVRCRTFSFLVLR